MKWVKISWTNGIRFKLVSLNQFKPVFTCAISLAVSWPVNWSSLLDNCSADIFSCTKNGLKGSHIINSNFEFHNMTIKDFKRNPVVLK